MVVLVGEVWAGADRLIFCDPAETSNRTSCLECGARECPCQDLESALQVFHVYSLVAPLGSQARILCAAGTYGGPGNSNLLVSTSNVSLSIE